MSDDSSGTGIDWEAANREASIAHALLKAERGGITGGALIMLAANAALSAGLELDDFLAICAEGFAAHHKLVFGEVP